MAGFGQWMADAIKNPQSGLQALAQSQQPPRPTYGPPAPQATAGASASVNPNPYPTDNAMGDAGKIISGLWAKPGATPDAQAAKGAENVAPSQGLPWGMLTAQYDLQGLLGAGGAVAGAHMPGLAPGEGSGDAVRTVRNQALANLSSPAAGEVLSDRQGNPWPVPFDAMAKDVQMLPSQKTGDISSKQPLFPEAQRALPGREAQQALPGMSSAFSTNKGGARFLNEPAPPGTPLAAKQQWMHNFNIMFPDGTPNPPGSTGASYNRLFYQMEQQANARLRNTYLNGKIELYDIPKSTGGKNSSQGSWVESPENPGDPTRAFVSEPQHTLHELYHALDVSRTLPKRVRDAFVQDYADFASGPGTSIPYRSDNFSQGGRGGSEPFRQKYHAIPREAAAQVFQKVAQGKDMFDNYPRTTEALRHWLPQIQDKFPGIIPNQTGGANP